MKKVVFLAAFISIISCAKAQDGAHQNAVKLNPLSLIFATGNVSYERAIGATTSVQLGAFFSGFSFSGIKYSGWGVTPEVRFYIAGQKQALNGVYIGPFVRYQNFTIKDKDTDDKASFNSIGGGAVFGWEKSWASGFVLDLFVGPSYNSGKIKADDGNDDEFDVKGGIDGFGLRTGITIGFSF
jgi:Protein of unknown function (DUF3575)